MMLPYKRPSPPETPAATSTQPEPPATAPVAVDSSNPSHADYNLHPLKVLSLDHYILIDVEDERFHVI